MERAVDGRHGPPGRPGRLRRLGLAAIRALPLSLRKRLVLMAHARKIPGRFELPFVLLADWSARDPDAFTRFVWTNHLAYARYWDAGFRFGRRGIHRNTRLILGDVAAELDRGGDLGGVRSILEVGASSGYNLRLVETEIFPLATMLTGLDIDRTALAEGRRRLRELGSRVELLEGDVADLGRILQGRSFDVILCPGVLMYLTPEVAQEAVARMGRHAGLLLAISSLPSPELDNGDLRESIRTGRPGEWFHNLDAMVRAAGGTIVARRYEQPPGPHIYSVVARMAPLDPEAGPP